MKGKYNPITQERIIGLYEAIMEKELTLKELSETVLKEFEKLNYCYNSICGFRASFNRVIAYADSLGMNRFSEELGRKYDTGDRVQELIELRINNDRLQNPATVTLTGKGNKSRCVPIMNKTRKILQTYLNENHLQENGRQQTPLFHNIRYEQFTRPGIAYILRKYFNLVKTTHPELPFPTTIHPNMVRHTKAIHLLEAGVKISVTELLSKGFLISTHSIY